ncbi:MAG TPA: C40 family peptidase [Actinocrinis sp.]|nr:C40 family peptidase [Actinocrinis sp.]
MSVRRRAVGTVLAPVLVAAASFAVCPPAGAATQQSPPRPAALPAAALDRKAVHRKPAVPSPSPSPSASARKGETAVHYAVSQLGKPYRYGGTGPDAFDCSGLTQQAWRAAGVSIPRTTKTQARAGAAVSLDRIQPGDVVVFYADASHVGIYAGDGKVIVSPHTGAVVKYAPLHSMPISTVRRPG